MKKLTDKINDSSTGGPKITLKGSDGIAVTVGAITSIKYTLTDSTGTVINNRQNVTLTVANPLYLELEPSDTAYSDGSTRIATITWVYTDTNWGANSTHIDEISIPISDMQNI